MDEICLEWQKLIQSNLAIRNFLVALKLFLNAKSSLSLWSKWQIGHRKWFLNTNLFLIKQFLTAKFDCIRENNFWEQFRICLLNRTNHGHSQSSPISFQFFFSLLYFYSNLFFKVWKYWHPCQHIFDTYYFRYRHCESGTFFGCTV